ncbi:hypothetical protein DC852_11365 [Vibrio parahaemolyticus]|nr:hypothetical protein [Vibrio parahaemolyticus]EGQ8938826.1 hypothetical protein [Vibrio parahaemolyticus]EGQ8947739.1 hypothetical protein [Vibrio parahaemolyticus]EGQ8968323.1 hypothetical protein [Vibrio parahaemolyticus]EGR1975413.1 hypothetical protein [Vibrio parahaemolyticus]
MTVQNDKTAFLGGFKKCWLSQSFKINSANCTFYIIGNNTWRRGVI